MVGVLEIPGGLLLFAVALDTITQIQTTLHNLNELLRQEGRRGLLKIPREGG
jgi:hypothetical protein